MVLGNKQYNTCRGQKYTTTFVSACMNLNVLSAKPVITGGTESLTAALGSSASMACEAVGYPQPEISWYKRDGNMPR